MDPANTPIDAVLTAVQARVPGTSVVRLAVTHPADDDNLWFISRPGSTEKIQIDSHADGEPPFLIESDDDQPVTAVTVQQAVDVIETWLVAHQ